MRLRILQIAFCGLVTTTAVATWAQSSGDQPDLTQVVRTVNGQDITLGHIAVAKESLPEQYRNLPANVLFPAILDQLVQQTVLAQSFDGAEPARITLAIENETRSLLAGEVIEQIMATPITSQDLNALYQERYSTGEAGMEYNAAHILVASQDEALRIKEDLDKGADFASTAREKSTGPSGPRGGDLGWFAEGVMVPAFEAAVLDLMAGEVSDPVQTQFGWHVIKLNDVREKDVPELASVQDELETELRRLSVENRIAELQETAEIVDPIGAEIDPGVLDLIDLSQ